MSPGPRPPTTGTQHRTNHASSPGTTTDERPRIVTVNRGNAAGNHVTRYPDAMTRCLLW
jgi:hypothetical protein